jgi:hypothetical protein
MQGYSNWCGLVQELGFLSGLGYAASLVEEPARRSWEPVKFVNRIGKMGHNSAPLTTRF